MNTTTRNFWIAACLLVATIAVSKLTERRVVESLAAPLESIPKNIDGWSAIQEDTLDARTLQVLLPTSYLSRTYAKDGRQLGVFIAYYSVQRAGENMHSPKNCLPGSGWDILSQDTTSIPVGGHPARINKYSVQRVGQRSLVYYWYQSKDRIIASEVFGKVMLVRDSLVDGRTAGMLARVTVADTGRDALDGAAFSGNLIRELQRCFGR